MVGRPSPPPLDDGVTARMSRMPVRNSKPEVALRRALHARGLRFRLHGSMPGRPDIVFTRARIVVFVDGCFWHGCLQHGVLPKNNRDWWREKLAATRERDERKDAALLALGWLPIHVWEHQSPAEAAEVIENCWRMRNAPRQAPTSVQIECDILDVDLPTPEGYRS